MKSKRIALLESEPLHMQLLLYNLERKGYHVECYEDAYLCLASLHRHIFDAFIISVQLDKADGLQIGRQIRAQGIQTPILFLSTTNEDVYLLPLSYIDEMKKPFEMATFLEKIGQLTTVQVSVN